MRVADLLSTDEREAAREARLAYVEEGEPGYGRRRRGRGFSYLDPAGEVVRDPELRARFASLAIPPAWVEVWICRRENGHVQATGRDDAGRKQYVYHSRWQQVRKVRMLRRLVGVGRVLGRLRLRVRRDLLRKGLVRERVLAATVRILDLTLVRIGNDEYVRNNGSYGLTTIRKKQVEIDRDRVVLRFPGKGGKALGVECRPGRRTVDVVAACLEAPGYDLFKYFAADGAKRDVKAEDVNLYLQEASGAPVSAKDLRTWGATVGAARELVRLAARGDDAGNDAEVLRALETVADRLANTVAVCRESYVHPEIVEGFTRGDLVSFVRRAHRQKRKREGLSGDESAVLSYLERRLD